MTGAIGSIGTGGISGLLAATEGGVTTRGWVAEFSVGAGTGAAFAACSAIGKSFKTD